MQTMFRKSFALKSVALRAGIAATIAVAGLIPLTAAAFASQGKIVLAQAEKPSGKGTINTIDAATRKLNMTHGPIPALKWDGMTMDFGVAPGVDIGALKPGAKVGFTLGRGADGMYVIDSIKPAE